MADRFGYQQNNAQDAAQTGGTMKRFKDMGDGTFAEVVYSGGGAAPTGAATEAKQDNQITLLGAVTETAPATDTASSGLNGRLQRIAQRITSVIALLAGGLPAALSAGGGVKAGIVDALPAGTNNIGDVDIAVASAASLANVTAAATTTVVFASNASARGRIVFNDCDKELYLKFGATASTSSFTVKIAAGGYYEFPMPLYTGAVDGIWGSSPTGAARKTELT